VNIGLAPFALALGIDVFVAVAAAGPSGVALATGVATLAAALTAWYGLPIAGRWLEAGAGIHDADRDKEDAMAEAKGTTVDTKVDHVLTEARVVLPGVQALLGFQLAGVLTDSFEQLPRSFAGRASRESRRPGARRDSSNRPGGASPRPTRTPNTFIAWRAFSSSVPSAPRPRHGARCDHRGPALDVTIVVRKLTQSPALAMGTGVVTGLVFVCVWYLVPVWARPRRESGETKAGCGRRSEEQMPHVSEAG